MKCNQPDSRSDLLNERELARLIRVSELRAQRTLGVENRDGVWWHEAPLPRRLHRCTPWTSSPEVDRCACGAIRGPFAHWLERNSRRRK